MSHMAKSHLGRLAGAAEVPQRTESLQRGESAISAVNRLTWRSKIRAPAWTQIAAVPAVNA